MQRAIAVVLVVTLTGCGLTMTTGPDPNRPPEQRPVCTETMDAPKKDGIGAVLGFVALIAGVAIMQGDNDDLGAAFVVGGVVTMAASYASGGVGYYRVKKCQKAIAEWHRLRG